MKCFIYLKRKYVRKAIPSDLTMRRMSISDFRILQKCLYNECNFCGKVFRTEVQLLQHSKTHAPDEEQRKHGCTICDWVFKTRKALSIHLKTHLPDDEKQSFECKFCDKVFKSRSGRDKHKFKHLSEEKVCCIKASTF